jgi:chemotaxis protein MotB
VAKRRKKEKKGDPGGAPLWMVTYSDMVTLLLTFFVMLLAMANFDDPGRVDAVIQSLQKAFGVGGYSPAHHPNDQNAAPATSEDTRKDEIQPVLTKLVETLSKKISDDLVKMTRTRTEVRVMLDERVLFAHGSTELHPTGYGVVASVAEAVGNRHVNIFVEGHSDGTGEPTQNWEISSMRAVTVVAALEARGVPGRRMEARGMGQYKPADVVDGNSNWNRRVELVIQADSTVGYEVLHTLGAGRGGIDATR